MRLYSILARTGGVVAAIGVSSVLGACGGQDSEASMGTTGSTSSALTAASASGRYIVVYKAGATQQGVAGKAVADVSASLEQQYGGRVAITYQYAIQGAAIDLPAGAADAMRADSRVAYVEPDQPGSIVATEPNATWGLDRIDQRNLPLDASYTYPDQAGTGVHAYVIDSGVFAAHPEFAAAGGGSRVIPGVDFQDNDADPDDCNGHGTHVAGTIGSATYGVAKNVTIHSIRVVDCGGFGVASTAIQAVDYVTHNHISPAVANMSLRYGFTQALNDAVTNSIASGVTYAIAAANDFQDACLTSPGSTPNAITVGATDITDTRASFSDFGTCVDLFAPGVDILSTWIQPALTNHLSGTSMASPHVAGAAALYLGANPSATPAAVATAIINQATPNVVVDPGTGSPNRFLFTGQTTPPTPCANLCSNPTRITINGSYQSGNIGTGATCFETTSPVHGGNCGNMKSPRTLSLNGTTMPCNNQNWFTLPAARNGGYCVQTTAGDYAWAFFTLW